MTAPAPSPAEQAVIDRFGIFDEERVIEEVARAIAQTEYESVIDEDSWVYAFDEWQRDQYREWAAAAVAAYRATQDGGAEQAVRRVEAVIAFVDACAVGIGPTKAAAYTDIANRLRAALAPQAGDGAR